MSTFTLLSFIAVLIIYSYIHLIHNNETICIFAWVLFINRYLLLIRTDSIYVVTIFIPHEHTFSSKHIHRI